jgi:hypothetical protein
MQISKPVKLFDGICEGGIRRGFLFLHHLLDIRNVGEKKKEEGKVEASIDCLRPKPKRYLLQSDNFALFLLDVCN